MRAAATVSEPARQSQWRRRHRPPWPTGCAGGSGTGPAPPGPAGSLSHAGTTEQAAPAGRRRSRKPGPGRGHRQGTAGRPSGPSACAPDMRPGPGRSRRSAVALAGRRRRRRPGGDAMSAKRPACGRGSAVGVTSPSSRRAWARGVARHCQCRSHGESGQGWQGRSGSLTSAPRPATPVEISAPRPANPSDPAQVTISGSLCGRAAAQVLPARLGHH
jgi:hypothetical protein